MKMLEYNKYTLLENWY